VRSRTPGLHSLARAQQFLRHHTLCVYYLNYKQLNSCDVAPLEGHTLEGHSVESFGTARNQQYTLWRSTNNFVAFAPVEKHEFQTRQNPANSMVGHRLRRRCVSLQVGGCPTTREVDDRHLNDMEWRVHGRPKLSVSRVTVLEHRFTVSFFAVVECPLLEICVHTCVKKKSPKWSASSKVRRRCCRVAHTVDRIIQKIHASSNVIKTGVRGHINFFSPDFR